MGTQLSASHRAASALAALGTVCALMVWLNGSGSEWLVGGVLLGGHSIHPGCDCTDELEAACSTARLAVGRNTTTSGEVEPASRSEKLSGHRNARYPLAERTALTNCLQVSVSNIRSK